MNSDKQETINEIIKHLDITKQLDIAVVEDFDLEELEYFHQELHFKVKNYLNTNCIGKVLELNGADLKPIENKYGLEFEILMRDSAYEIFDNQLGIKVFSCNSRSLVITGSWLSKIPNLVRDCKTILQEIKQSQHKAKRENILSQILVPKDIKPKLVFPNIFDGQLHPIEVGKDKFGFIFFADKIWLLLQESLSTEFTKIFKPFFKIFDVSEPKKDYSAVIENEEKFQEIWNTLQAEKLNYKVANNNE